MKTSERLNLVAPCGIDCGICELLTCKDSPQLFEQLVAKGIPKDNLPCKGCRPMKGKCPIIGETCDSYKCVTSKKIDLCYKCNDFPCKYLHPSADRAGTLPHNMKVFNLCKIKKDGLEKFVENSSEIKKLYYSGKMVIGKGPQI